MYKLYLALLLLLTFSTTLKAQKDQQKLYQSDEIKIKLISDDLKRQSFQVRRNDGELLRKASADEQYFIDKSGGKLQIDYKITQRIGGVDITYSLYNPTNSFQPIPDFTVDGLTFKNAHQHLNILNTLNFQYMHKRAFSEKGFKRLNSFHINGVAHPYPVVYSPVIVAHDGHYAAGSALLFEYAKDQLEPYMKIAKQKSGLWRYSYGDINNRALKPYEKLNVTLTIRFSSPKNWLYTLYPYKEHFNALYEKERDNVPKDLRPISGLLLSYGSAAYENYLECQQNELACTSSAKQIADYNLYGYNYYIRPDLYGLDGANAMFDQQKFISTYIKRLQKSGFERTMLWTLSGQYWKCPKEKIQNIDGFIECSTNYPSQLTNTPAPKVKHSLLALQKFSEANISLGLWWGRSGEVPTPLSWNPDSVAPFDIKDPLHVHYYENELKSLQALGVREIGLDAYTNMDIQSRLPWLKKMKEKFTSNMKFTHEGSVSDYLHTQSAAFLQPQNRWFSGNQNIIKDKAYLMEYLNPEAEVIVYYPEHSPDLQKLQQLIDWGYTPLLLAHPNIFEVPLIDINPLKIK